MPLTFCLLEEKEHYQNMPFKNGNKDWGALCHELDIHLKIILIYLKCKKQLFVLVNKLWMVCTIYYIYYIKALSHEVVRSPLMENMPWMECTLGWQPQHCIDVYETFSRGFCDDPFTYIQNMCAKYFFRKSCHRPSSRKHAMNRLHIALAASTSDWHVWDLKIIWQQILRMKSIELVIWHPPTLRITD